MRSVSYNEFDAFVPSGGSPGYSAAVLFYSAGMKSYSKRRTAIESIAAAYAKVGCRCCTVSNAELLGIWHQDSTI